MNKYVEKILHNLTSPATMTGLGSVGGMGLGAAAAPEGQRTEGGIIGGVFGGLTGRNKYHFLKKILKSPHLSDNMKFHIALPVYTSPIATANGGLASRIILKDLPYHLEKNNMEKKSITLAEIGLASLITGFAGRQLGGAYGKYVKDKKSQKDIDSYKTKGMVAGAMLPASLLTIAALKNREPESFNFLKKTSSAKDDIPALIRILYNHGGMAGSGSLLGMATGSYVAPEGKKFEGGLAGGVAGGLTGLGKSKTMQKIVNEDTLQKILKNDKSTEPSRETLERLRRVLFTPVSSASGAGTSYLVTKESSVKESFGLSKIAVSTAKIVDYSLNPKKKVKN